MFALLEVQLLIAQTEQVVALTQPYKNTFGYIWDAKGLFWGLILNFGVSFGGLSSKLCVDLSVSFSHGQMLTIKRAQV